MNASIIRSGIPDLLPMLDRSEGCHVSTLIRDICIRTGRYQNDYEADMTKLQLGCSLEHAVSLRYSLQYPTRYLFGVELFLDNIYGTADIIDIEENIVEEIKLTWISSNRNIDDIMFWQFIVQLMAYCKMLGTLIGHLHLCHISFNPVYNVWQLEFTQEELDENWMMLRTHRDRMLLEGYKFTG